MTGCVASCPDPQPQQKLRFLFDQKDLASEMASERLGEEVFFPSFSARADGNVDLIPLPLCRCCCKAESRASLP